MPSTQACTLTHKNSGRQEVHEKILKDYQDMLSTDIICGEREREGEGEACLYALRKQNYTKYDYEKLEGHRITCHSECKYLYIQTVDPLLYLICNNYSAPTVPCYKPSMCMQSLFLCGPLVVYTYISREEKKRY